MASEPNKIRKIYLQSTEYDQGCFKSILDIQDQWLHRKLKMFSKIQLKTATDKICPAF